MPEYLSDAWFAEAAAALAADDSICEASRGVHLVFEQRVTPSGADAAPGIIWHVELDDGAVALHRGPADEPTVTLSCDLDTAEAIQSGRASAQAAFMNGRLRLGGDVRALLAHQGIFQGLTDALAHVRSVPAG